MVAWLSDWLRNIIAVIMLAVFMELLLPNKAMQRYARLVVGLLILLTILSPVLRLLQGDFDTKLNEGIRLWEQSSATQDVKMPSLADIQKNADKLSDKRSEEAAALTEQTLEKAMGNAISEKTKAKVEQVDVALKWVVHDGQRTPYLSRVLILMGAEQREDTGSKAVSKKPDVQVEEVQPVDVSISVSADNSASQTAEASENGAGNESPDKTEHSEEEAWARVSPALAEQIGEILADGWGVSPDIVQIRQPAAG